MKTNIILNGDCIEHMKELPDNSVDAIITDPPYNLGFMGKEWDTLDKTQFGKKGEEGENDLKIKKNFNVLPRYNAKKSGFQEFMFEFGKEALRVLKPGGYLLSMGGTRTYHRLVCGIEDAGFEIRDTIMWLYGSGFPKSLNIGKQIDKIHGNEREDLGIIKGVGNNNTNSMNSGESKTSEFKHEYVLTKGNSEWEGWGTALKPACEPIVVARKPLSEKNVALNVLKWGTGGINIDECRIGTTHPSRETINNEKGMFNLGGGKIGKEIQGGRFPANIILDEEAGRMLDEQSGNTGAFAPVKQAKRPNNVYGDYEYFGDNGKTFRNDKGGASRFFYCAKASKSERNLGCEEMEIKQTTGGGGGIGDYLEDVNSASGKYGSEKAPAKNNHPTVKPIKLMEYLIKLISREGAIILDPFIGSGTTAIACLKLNRQFIGIEKEPEYIKIAKARIKPYLEQTKLVKEKK